MARSVAARGKLALAFRELFAFCGSARCKGQCAIGGDTTEAVHGSGIRAFDLGASPRF